MKHLALSLWAILLSALCAPAHAAATESFNPFEGIIQELADGNLQQDIPDDDLLSDPPVLIMYSASLQPVTISSNVKKYPLIGDFPPLFTQPPSSVRAGIGGYIELPDLEEGNAVEEPQDYDQKYDEEQESDMPVLSMQGAEEEQQGINVVDSAAAPPDDSGTKAPR